MNHLLDPSLRRQLRGTLSISWKNRIIARLGAIDEDEFKQLKANVLTRPSR